MLKSIVKAVINKTLTMVTTLLSTMATTFLNHHLPLIMENLLHIRTKKNTSVGIVMDFNGALGAQAMGE